jgi:uncharacterized protein (UPF0332 family)
MDLQKANIEYRIERAEQSLEEALLLADNKRWNTAINRLYYSCFYAVIALLLRSNIKTSTHKGTRSQFGLHFIKTGKIAQKYGTLYTTLFDLRQKGDYGDMFDFTEEQVIPLLKKVPEFLSEIKKHIHN